jgi:hypothetical protein
MESRTGIAKRAARIESKRRSLFMDAGGGSWGIINIVGPLLLAAVLLWVLLRNRKTSKRDIDRSEQGTREVYREEEEKRRSGDDARS